MKLTWSKSVVNGMPVHTTTTPNGQRWVCWNNTLNSFVVADNNDMRIPVGSIEHGIQTVEAEFATDYVAPKIEKPVKVKKVKAPKPPKPEKVKKPKKVKATAPATPEPAPEAPAEVALAA